eukprot:238623-Hanusia_phi.AAC.1
MPPTPDPAPPAVYRSPVASYPVLRGSVDDAIQREEEKRGLMGQREINMREKGRSERLLRRVAVVRKKAGEEGREETGERG